MREECTMKEVKLSIDDREVTVPEHFTVLQAAAQAGVKIPTLCHLWGLTPSSACRICVVEVEGGRTLGDRPVRIRSAAGHEGQNPDRTGIEGAPPGHGADSIRSSPRLYDLREDGELQASGFGL